jgi:ankyrin repeat protein
VDAYLALSADKSQSPQEKDSLAFRKATAQVDPFYDDSSARNVFLSSQGVVLANMDAIFKFTGHYGGLLKQRMEKTFEKIGLETLIPYAQPVGLFAEDEAFLFCDIGGGPGGFSDYIQFRVRENRIYGMTRKDPQKDWETRRLSTRYLDLTYGDNGRGDIFTNSDFYVDYVRTRQPKGVHLVAAHSDPIKLREETPFLANQEWWFALTFLQEVIMGLKCCRVGGRLVILVTDLVTTISAQILYVLAQCFGSLWLFKPFSTSTLTSEQYVVALDRQEDVIVQVYLDLLQTVRDSYKGLDYTLPLGFDPRNPRVSLVTSFLQDPLPIDFEEWLTQYNTIVIQRQRRAFSDREKILSGVPVDLVNYNLRMALKIWSLPGNPVRLPPPMRKSRQRQAPSKPSSVEDIPPTERTPSQRVEWILRNVEGVKNLDEVLLVATEAGDIEVVEYLLAQPEIHLPVRQDRYNKSTPLLIAAKNGDPDIVRLLLEDGRSDPRATMLGGCSSASIVLASDPPRRASKERLADYLDVLEQLIEDGRADLGACYSEALSYAAEKGFTDAVRLLLAQPSVDPSQISSRALGMASWFGHSEIVEILLQDGRSDPNALHEFDFTIDSFGMIRHGMANALGLAARAGHLDIVKMLLQDPRTDPTGGVLTESESKEDTHRSAALAWASGVGRLEVVKLLLEDGRADPSASEPTPRGRGLSAAVLYAVLNENLEILQLLLEDERVSKDSQSIQRYIQVAQKYRSNDVVKLLSTYLE